MKLILLIMIGFSVLNADFIKNGDVVKDSISKLEWQDDVIGTTMTWVAAINYCESLPLDGGNWRLPNINELKSIVDRTKTNPAIVNAFENIGTGNYWSSTTSENIRYDAWIINFFYGSVTYGGRGNYKHNYEKDSNEYVRCVRDGQ